MKYTISSVCRAMLFVALIPVVPLAAQTDPLLVERDVTVGSMVSDRFTWRDAANQPRVAVLAHNDGAAGPGGTRGGELREFRYETPLGTRIVRAATTSGASGFGYVVSHPHDSEACMAGAPDTSALGHFISGTFTRVFEGPHHAIFRFNQVYPRYCATNGAPGAPINVPVTLEWVFSTGRDHPLWAVTYDLSAVPANTLLDDSRAPYGELLFDGSASEGAHSPMAGVAWGDRYKFFSTLNPVTYNSGWTWNTPNTIPFVKLWTTDVDATMGTVQTQTIVQQDAGGYFGTDRWNSTSAAGPACPTYDGPSHVMPCSFNWPYQSINYSMGAAIGQDNDIGTINTRLAWGTNFGFLGQSQYPIHGSNYWGGPLPLPDTYAPGWPMKSYSTFVVLGLHSVDPVGAQVSQIETVQATTVTASIGTVRAAGRAGVNRPDAVTYSPVGWNHVYAAWALRAVGNQLDANFNVAAGTLTKPLLIISDWTAGLPTTVRFNGAVLTQDADYFPSLRPSASELWITLNRSLSGATNRLELVTSAPPLPSLSIDDVSVTEGNAGTTNAVFTVSLSAASAQTVTVAFATANGTASAGSDYASFSGSLTFAPSETAKTITVGVLGDGAVEGNETFTVDLSGATNATIGDAQGVGTIVDDDPAPILPTLSINDVTVSEGNAGTSTATFTLTLSAVSGTAVTVVFATADGTATAGSDYGAAAGAITFAPGQVSRTVAVVVNGDATAEPDETFTLTLSAPVGATFAKAVGTGTIGDDDGGVSGPRISIDDRQVTEGGAANAAFRLLLSSPSSQTVTVAYSTADGSATAPGDYSATSGVVTFTPGRTQHSMFVPVAADGATEGTESFFVNLSNPTGATLLDGQAVGTIVEAALAAHVAVYRAYNPVTDYHFFTTDLASKTFAVGVLGFRDESTPVPFYLLGRQESGSVPLFRMYNPNLGRHYYTADVASRDFLMGLGMVYEKDESFLYPLGSTPPAGTTELFRLYNNNSGTHLFTADAAQKDQILSLFPGVWVSNTSVGYVFTSP